MLHDMGPSQESPWCNKFSRHQRYESVFLVFLVCRLPIRILVWGFLSLGSIQAASEPVPRFLPIYLWSVLAINILISGITGKVTVIFILTYLVLNHVMTVGRILWVAHIAQPHLGHRNLRHFHFIIATL